LCYVDVNRDDAAKFLKNVKLSLVAQVFNW
jgi:hypothetical protein